MSPCKSHPNFTPPKKDVRIWRFINIDKLILLLKDGLYFSSSEIIAKKYDPWEGIIPQKSLDATYNFLKNDKRSIVVSNASSLIEQIKLFSKDLRPSIFLSCWHINNIESKHMWDTYTTRKLGIAIQSSYKKLCQSLEKSNHRVYVGCVQYGETIIDMDGILCAYLNKRIQFQHDHELRCVILDPKNKSKGILVKSISLNDLIENIYVEPNSSDSFLKKIQVIVDNNNLGIQVKKSTIDEKPPY